MKMTTQLGVAHFALDLRARRERRDRVNNHHIQRTRANQRVGDFQRLLAGIRLRDEHRVDIHADARSIVGIERVLSVDECNFAAALLRLRDDVQRKRGFAGGLRTVDLDDSAARHAADAKCSIKRQRTSGDGVDNHFRLVAQTHDGALAEVLFDLLQRRFQRFFLVAGCGFWRVLSLFHSQIPFPYQFCIFSISQMFYKFKHLFY